MDGAPASFSDTVCGAAYEGKLAVVEHLIEADASLLTKRDGDGRTPLHWAAAGGRDDVVAWLLRRGADVNTTDDEGFTPLISAAASGSGATLRALLGAGANVKAVNANGQTALHYHKGRSPVITELLSAGADANASDMAGSTPLHRAAGPGHLDALRALLAHPATTVDPVDRYGATPLHRACEEGRVEAAVVLLGHGANVEKKDREGRTPLDVCLNTGVRNAVASAARG